ncbi:MAG: sodium:solute symporter [Acidobacteria bacterium]|nr:MAG: sodium:solute symporter [Acidobacteriota bacterium]REK03064.1 MAG: sodium:solute symporter [Acidobacteriota bacterium]REK13132.1 MAG: sodium:solute symporter [Acidobacteriota bacterium]REK41126.1 MAG: sodium:solute symporter [Acidobacteriota bacterium]
MRWLDWTIVVAYLAYVIWDGVRLSRGSYNDAEGFFLANRSLPWWAVGLSVMATQMSAITLVGTTGQAYDDGMRFLQFYYALPFAMIILCVTVVPFFHRAKVYTAYEYLENRFDLKTRTLTSFFFLISRGLGVGVIIAAPAVILSIVFGWSEVITIFVIGLTTTFYTMFGGVRAVTWTDVKQMAIIFVGLAGCLYVILNSFPAGFSVTDGLNLAGATGKLTTIETSFDLKEKYTIWSGLFAALFLFLSYFGCDQSQVQRFLTAKSVDQGRTSLLMSAFLKIPMQFVILLIGVLVFVFYQFQQPPMIFNQFEANQAIERNAEGYGALEERYKQAHAGRSTAATEFIEAKRGTDASAQESAKSRYLEANKEFAAVRNDAKEFIKKTNSNDSFNDVNYVFPTFIVNRMPLGLVGLMIAAIFAAAMSSISSELNALATASTIDFYKRHFNPDGTDRQFVMFGRFATAVWGLFACVVAIYATNLGSLIEVVNKFGSYFYGSLLGVFVLAIGIKRARARGAFFGLLIGMAAVGIASNYTEIEFLWFNVVGCLVTVLAGYLISLTTE